MKKIIEKALSKGAERAEVFFLENLRTDVDYEAGRLKSISDTEELGVALRLVNDGKLGFATTTKLEDAGRLVDDALATAAEGEQIAFEFSTEAQFSTPSISDERVKSLSVEEMMKHSEVGIARLLDYEKSVNAESGTARQVQRIGVMTSRGFEGEFERTMYQFYVGGLLVEGTNMLQTGDVYSGTDMGADRDAITESAIRDLRRGRTNVGIAPGKTTVVLTPRAVADIFLTLNLGVSGLYVDERISPLAGRLGETILDERITIRDDGLRAGAYSSAAFDDEGVPMRKTMVFENGVLKSYLTDRRTAAKLEHQATGNGLKAKRLIMSKELGKMPAPEITNWVMDGGDRSYDELMSEIGSGVLVDSIMGIVMSNLAAGDFSGNILYGLKIESGKTVGRVKDAMISGNVYELFRDSIVALSKEVVRTGIMGGIGSHWYPYVVLKDVSIAAKA
ncbi:TldD/PmbA family protein [bacterium]|nr:TldD/PmbA family protein [bacterium]